MQISVLSFLSALYCLFFCQFTYAHYAIPSGFVYLHTVDSTIDQHISFATADNCIGHRLVGYESQQAICTLALAKALKGVQVHLKKINPHYSFAARHGRPKAEARSPR